MKKLKRLFAISLFFVVINLLSISCSSPRNLIFAERDWHISNYYGQIIDKDTTFRFTFGDVLIPDPLVIVSSQDSLIKYPGMDKFLSDILKTTHLDNVEILFYTPEMQTMLVQLQSDMVPLRPSSISFSLKDENPVSMWYSDDDIEKWNRKPGEMYTYTYYNKKKKQLLIVDCFDYGDIPVAQITILQNRNKSTDKMNLPPPGIRAAFYKRPDYSKYMKYLEPISYTLEARRSIAFGNYKIGQEQKQKNTKDNFKALFFSGRKKVTYVEVEGKFKVMEL